MSLLKSLLIVDDSHTDQFIMKRQLKPELPGIEIITACDGYSAIETLLAHQKSIGAVLLDLNMPVHDGFEFLTNLKSLKHIYLPIIICTGSLLESDFERCKSIYPIVDCFEKPLSPENIIRLSMLLNDGKLKSQTQLSPPNPGSRENSSTEIASQKP